MDLVLVTISTSLRESVLLGLQHALVVRGDVHLHRPLHPLLLALHHDKLSPGHLDVVVVCPVKHSLMRPLHRILVTLLKLLAEDLDALLPRGALVERGQGLAVGLYVGPGLLQEGVAGVEVQLLLVLLLVSF